MDTKLQSNLLPYAGLAQFGSPGSVGLAQITDKVVAMPMPRGQNWSRVEVVATVDEYFQMLRWYLTGQSFNKAQRMRNLAMRLDNRSVKAIGLKFQNISAVLKQMSCWPLPGFQPMSNFQALLVDVVQEKISGDVEFDRIALQASEQIATVPDTSIIADPRVAPPPPAREQDVYRVKDQTARFGVRRDYVEREARNQSLGKAGELFVAEFESRFLHAHGFADLANKVEHRAATVGDGLGYDVLSFEFDGREKFIEVKTTKFAIGTPFFVTRNELRFSAEVASQFVLSRVHDFNLQPRLFELHGDLNVTTILSPVSYEARVR